MENDIVRLRKMAAPDPSGRYEHTEYDALVLSVLDALVQERDRLRGIIDERAHPDRGAGSCYAAADGTLHALVVYWWHDNYKTAEQWRLTHLVDERSTGA